ncbi:hypothetical protein FKM82_020351 [Ascaphus truei]
MGNNQKETFKIKQYMNCHTEYVIYLLECPCGLQYVGKTKRAIKTRILEHLSNIRRGVLTHSVSKHFALFHNSSTKGLKFTGIENVLQHWRGRSRDIDLSKREMFWIHKLNTLIPHGLNADFEIIPFLIN